MLLRSLQLPRPIYAIAMSGFGMGADQLKSKEVGCRYHLLKPLDPKQLDAVLQEASHELYPVEETA